MHLDPRKAVVLPNGTCPYCARSLDGLPSTKEHTVSRRFVPKGALHQSWNLILRACRSCNGRKSDLEDDISAVTLQPDAWGQYPRDDRTAAQEGVRKAKHSFSRRTKRPVDASTRTITVTAPLGPGLTASMNLVAPPQIDRGRAFELARLQLSALFYWITYDRATRVGRPWPGGFFPIHVASRGDWGNPLHLGFMRSVLRWDPRVVATGAGGYFKVVIRRHPDAACWSWALEWNANYRLLGFFGDEIACQAAARQLPPLVTGTTARGPQGHSSLRREEPLAEEDDVLFVTTDHTETHDC